MVWLIYKLFWNCEDCCLQSCVFSMHIRLLGFKPNKCYRVSFRACNWAIKPSGSFMCVILWFVLHFPMWRFCNHFQTRKHALEKCYTESVRWVILIWDNSWKILFYEKINSKIWNSSQVIFHVLHSSDVFISIFKFGLYFGFHTHTAMHWWTVVRRWHFTFPPFSTLAQDDKISLSNNLTNFCLWNIEFLVHTFKLSVGRV